MTVKPDDVTKGRKDLDPHGRFRGEWVNPLNSVFNFKYSVKIWSCSNLASIGDKMS